MYAIMLAAGVGSRLDPAGGHPPKVLLEIGGRTLLRRHLDILARSGVAGLEMVVGYRADDIRAEIARAEAALGRPGFVRTVTNPDFRDGSVVSLWTARRTLAGGGSVLLMDADVLYDYRMIERLLGSPHGDCFLLDRDFEPGEEPVKLCIRDGRPVEFRKRISGAYDLCGESVGFFRFRPATAARIAEVAEGYVAAGRREEPYEEVLREVMLEERDGGFGWEDVTGLPWTEIDFPEDVVRAETEVLPRLEDPPA